MPLKIKKPDDHTAPWLRNHVRLAGHPVAKWSVILATTIALAIALGGLIGVITLEPSRATVITEPKFIGFEDPSTNSAVIVLARGDAITISSRGKVTLIPEM